MLSLSQDKLHLGMKQKNDDFYPICIIPALSSRWTFCGFSIARS